MKSKSGDHEVEIRQGEPDAENQGEIETPVDADEFNDLDESDLGEIDDDRWDVFILDDDDGDPLPDYGDFWMPD